MTLITIRRARLEDAAALAGLMGELGYPASAAALARRLELLLTSELDDVYVGLREGCLVGVGSIHVARLLHANEPLARITALVVGEAARGAGIGSALVEHLERLARARGCSVIEVTSAERRAGAHRFYEARGYTYQGRRFVKSLCGDPPAALAPKVIGEHAR